MLTTNELLKLLRQREVRNVEIARVLGLPASRVSEIFAEKRSLKLDEAAKLVAAFGLEDAPFEGSEAVMVPLIKHIAEVLGEPLGDEDQRLKTLKSDLKAFGHFQADPAMRFSALAVESFFRGLRTHRPI